MHRTSKLKMEAFLKLYAANSSGKTVLDVGSRAVQVSTTYRAETDQYGLVYTGLDMEAGNNVDIVPANPFIWDEIADEQFDYVISGQTFEHNPYMWVTFCEIARVLRQGGHACIIAPSAGNVHRFPVDCWRYYPDSWAALCEVSGLVLTESIREVPLQVPIRGSNWMDSAVVATKPRFASAAARNEFYENIAGIVAPFKKRHYKVVKAELNGGPAFAEYQAMANRAGPDPEPGAARRRKGAAQRGRPRPGQKMQAPKAAAPAATGLPWLVKLAWVLPWTQGKAPPQRRPERNTVAAKAGRNPARIERQRKRQQARAARLQVRNGEGEPNQAGQKVGPRAGQAGQVRHSVRRINTIAGLNGAKSYLEIGVRKGITFNELSFPRKVAVDPVFDFNPGAQPGVDFFETTSDDYFANFAHAEKFDIVFIDGLHVFDQAYRDFLNSLKHAHDRTVWLVDDVVPIDKYSALPDFDKALEARHAAGRKSRAWHGDVYKVIFAIHDLQPAYSYATINSGGNPQAVVWKAERRNVRPVYGSVEAIDKVGFDEFLQRQDLMNLRDEDEVFRALGAAVR